MMSPDTMAVTEVLLLTNGFISATKLATKLVKCLEFLKHQLSMQVRIYNFTVYTLREIYISIEFSI